MSLDDRAIAIGATFTAEGIQPGLAFWAGELGLTHQIRFAAYNTLFQELLDPTGLFASNAGGINLALVRLQDWIEAGVDRQVTALADAARNAAARFSAPLILVVCPASPEHAPALRCAEETLLHTLEGTPSLYLLKGAEIDEFYPVRSIHDPHGEDLGRLPYTPEFFVALATAVARKIHAILTPPFKVAALDCDDTLWAGICGEDGPQGVELDEPRRGLQTFMAERRESGLLLALCSKNNEEDVFETFRAHPEMPLHLEDFAAWRINWDSKASNLAALAAELELGLDSFILVDDNLKECAEAQSGAPDALALPLPARAEEIPDFLKHVWAFDRARVTDEDRRRPELYAQRAERARAAQAAGSLKEFLASLELEIGIQAAELSQLPRVAQLTQRTNQMNATLARRTEPEVQNLLAGGMECLVVNVKDRFGAYGLTGAMLFRTAGTALAVDTFVLSCRALGRGVEHRMVARLGAIARERGLERVEIPFIPGQRNRPAALFLESLRQAGPDGVFRFPAAEAAAVEYRPGQKNGNGGSGPKPEKSNNGSPRKRIDYARIATELRDPYAILERIRTSSRRSAQPGARLDPPRTPLERELTELWAGLLNLPAVGIHDNFFELGGHSLLAVQLLSRVRQIHGIDLSLEVVYSGEFTVAELAKSVELKEIEQAGGDYQDLLNELEGLSDEQVKQLLAEEQDA